jgi:hypothetical protein
MSFIPAVRREIGLRAHPDPVRMTLEFLLAHAVGRDNAIPLNTIAAHLRGRVAGQFGVIIAADV